MASFDLNTARFFNPHYVYAPTGGLSTEQVESVVRETIEASGMVTRYMLNVIITKDGLLGLTYMWFSNAKVANALKRYNYDGSHLALGAEPLLKFPSVTIQDEDGEDYDVVIDPRPLHCELPDPWYDHNRLYCPNVPEHIGEDFFRSIFANFVSDPSKVHSKTDRGGKTTVKQYPLINIRTSGGKGRGRGKGGRKKTATITFNKSSCDGLFAMKMCQFLSFPPRSSNDPRRQISRLQFFRSRDD